MTIKLGSIIATLGTTNLFDFNDGVDTAAVTSAIFFGANLLNQVIVAFLLLGQEAENVDVTGSRWQTKRSLMRLFVVPELIKR